MGRKKIKNDFEVSAYLNNTTYITYFNRLKELSISMFEWLNIPDTVDPRYIELALFENGSAIYFNDEIIGDLCLSNASSGSFGAYGEPLERRAYSRYNNYQRNLTAENSVIIWNNYLRSNCYVDIRNFAIRLYNLDRIIDVNANAQKTPILVQGTEQQKLTLKNLYMQYDGNAPVIYGDSSLDLNSLKILQTNAPYVCDKIYTLKSQIWNEALTYLGISNINVQKKERLITDEVTRNMGGTIASRYSRLQARREAVEKINRMFGTDIVVNYREDFQSLNVDLDGGSSTLKEGGCNE